MATRQDALDGAAVKTFWGSGDPWQIFSVSWGGIGFVVPSSWLSWCLGFSVCLLWQSWAWSAVLWHTLLLCLIFSVCCDVADFALDISNDSWLVWWLAWRLAEPLVWARTQPTRPLVSVHAQKATWARQCSVCLVHHTLHPFKVLMRADLRLDRFVKHL